MADIFSVDLKGLSNLLPQDGLSWIVNELVQNAWDQDVQQVRLELDKMSNTRNRVRLAIEDDDPIGFINLAHSFTLFAKSHKLGNAEKRGRFNLGEKLVIAYAIASGGSVKIESTKGGFHFSKDGRTSIRKKRASGSRVEVVFKATQTQYDELVQHIGTLIPPKNHTDFIEIEQSIKTTLTKPTLIKSVTGVNLPTMLANSEGVLRRTRRNTTVDLYEVTDGDTPYLYEMGIPVVPSETPYHIDIQQKIPLNMQRDNVTPAYFKAIATIVLNATADLLTIEQVNQSWVKEAMEDKDVDAESVEAVLDTKYGKKRVVHDPNHPESSAVAAAKGFTVIYGGNESRSTWQNIRTHQPVTSAGIKFDTTNTVSFDPNGQDVSLPEDQWTDGMKSLVQFCIATHEEIFGEVLSVQYFKDPRGYLACYSRNSLTFNYRSIGKKKCSKWKNHLEYFVDLIIHEFAHRYGSSHFSEDYWRGTTKVGAKMALLLRAKPELLD